MIDKWIRYHRRQMGWNQTQVGSMLGVPQREVSHWECGERVPDPELVRQLAIAFKSEAPAVPAVEG